MFPEEFSPLKIFLVFLAVFSYGVAQNQDMETGNNKELDDPLNVILILADDVGYEAFGAYGSTQYRTPRIDELTAAGALFTNAYSKSRYAPRAESL